MKSTGKTNEVRHGRGCIFRIQYHVVWCTKYRRKVLRGPVEQRLFELLDQIALDNAFSIAEYNAAEDHVHLLLDCTPQNFIPDMIKALKGVSARLLMKEFGDELRKQLWGGHLWNPSYFVATVSENTRTQVTEYIRGQKEK